MKRKSNIFKLSKVIENQLHDNKSKSEGIQDELDIPKFMNVNNSNTEVVRRDSSDFKIPSFLSKPGVVRIVEDIPMTQGYIDVLKSRIKAMPMNEKVVVAEALPVDICIDRIKTEYEKNSLFVNSIKESFSILGIDM